ncbi:sensor histidine kinase [Streptacidiphilus monticola]|uniref:histidine kinase n=1 Tax=Streptacidiphilus monticola TaxID=2161674 RepID=A0ABW1FYY9_9ACTN
MRLSTRIALVTMALVPVVVLGAGLLLLGLVARDLSAAQDATLRQRAAAALPDTRQLLRAAAQDRTGVERSRGRSLAASTLDVGVRVVSDGGVLLAEGPQPDPGLGLPQPTGDPVSFRAGGATWRVLGQPVTGLSAGVHGQLWLFAPASVVRGQTAAVRRRMLLAALLAVPVSGALAWVAAEGAARPLRRLQQRTSGLDPRTGGTRLDHRPSGVAEVDDLAATLQTALTRYDEQARRTEEALATARTFASAASHELRTPLMSMRTDLDVLGAHPGLDAGERAQIVSELQDEHARVVALLTALQQLARGDLVESEDFRDVELTELVDTAVLALRRRLPEARVELRAAAGLRVRGWEPGLRIAVENLLANAAVHGCRPGEPLFCEVELGADGNQARLVVQDAGPGVPEAEREAVFERFRRRPGSPGSGLGLTLVAQQAALHRGSVRIAPSARGARFELRLPLAGPGAAEGPAAAELPERGRWFGGPQGFHKEPS